ncbi:MAG: hypothetical protein BWK77_07735 [Verrucomicrobia bacterium A1]|nr:MAG: hypothetical protein BWK77_07735 [Verrucomicrobia bacterium A1]
MAGLVLILLLSGAVARAAMDEAAAPAEAPAYPDARELLSAVLAGLPDVPVRITAQIQSKSRSGTLEKTLTAEMDLDWRGRPPTARYIIRDAFGGNAAGLNITWKADGRRTLRYFTGPSLVSAALPDLDTPIEGTDISWLDLSLSFLWWSGGQTVGAEKIKGRFCHIVDLPAPESDSASCAGVRLWIDPEIHILLQAATYDREGQLLKLLEVKSFRKIGDVWVIQNIDVQSFPMRHKTSLRVRQAAPESPASASRDAETD